MLTLSDVKQHLNIPATDKTQDEKLTRLLAVAQTEVLAFLDRDDDNEELLGDPMVQQAILMDVATLFNNAESEVYSHTQRLLTFERLLSLRRRWNV